MRRDENASKAIWIQASTGCVDEVEIVNMSIHNAMRRSGVRCE